VLATRLREGRQTRDLGTYVPNQLAMTLPGLFNFGNTSAVGWRAGYAPSRRLRGVQQHAAQRGALEHGAALSSQYGVCGYASALADSWE
jgi:hypothetical protein